MLKQIITDLSKLANPDRAKHSSGFFKTGKGEYGEGDKFLGITVPQQRQVAKKYFKDVSLSDIRSLLISKYHDHRFTALILLLYKNKTADDKTKKIYFDFYLKNTKLINNWDLVDVTCHKIVGDFLLDKDRSILYKLAKSNILWERRISLISTFAFIRKNQFEDSIKLAQILIHDKHDLIQKAVGWMLREIGKKNMEVEESFLKKYSLKMGRTALRYAIEKFPESKRKYYLSRTG